MTLTHCFVKETFVYDEVTGILSWRNNRRRGIQANSEAGWTSAEGYRTVTLQRKSYLVHRVIWLYVHGSFPQGQIDHINGNRIDNRIENLRDVSFAENRLNKKRHRSGRLYGCSFNKAQQKWISQITINKKIQYLGSFKTEQEAHLAYVKAFEEYFGMSLFFQPVVIGTSL